MPATYFTYVDRDGEYFLSYDGEIIPDDRIQHQVEHGEVRVCVNCASIGRTQDFTTFQFNGEDISYCEPCAAQHCARCERCNTIGSTNINLGRHDMSRGTTQMLCRTCYDTLFRRCNNCGNSESIETIIENEGRFWCTGCAGERFPQCKYCANRHLGKRICRCGSDKPIGYLTNRYFSIELEIIDPEAESTTAWRQVHDGSLNSGGKEYVSGPFVGQAAIDEIHSECQKLGGYIDNSCGFHIHLDFGNESAEDVSKFAAACQVLEPFAFSVVTRNRDNSRFCKKYDKGMLKKLKELPLEYLVYGTNDSHDLNRAKTHKYHQSRYHWFNLHSYYFRGTVEIRHHHGTKNPESILKWAELWLKVADWSKTKKIDDITCMSPEDIISCCGIREDTKAYLLHKKLIYVS